MLYSRGLQTFPHPAQTPRPFTIEATGGGKSFSPLNSTQVTIFYVSLSKISMLKKKRKKKKKNTLGEWKTPVALLQQQVSIDHSFCAE